MKTRIYPPLALLLLSQVYNVSAAPPPAQSGALVSLDGQCLNLRQNYGGAAQVYAAPCRQHGDNTRWSWNQGRVQTEPGLCLGADPQYFTRPGAEVLVGQCQNGNHQRWDWDGSRLRNSGGLCLEFVHGSHPSNIQLGACRDKIELFWQLDPARLSASPQTPPQTVYPAAPERGRGEAEPLKRVRPGHPGNPQSGKNLSGPTGSLLSESGLCLEVLAAETHTNGAKVRLWECRGGAHQRWTYQDGRLHSAANPAKCLDIDGGDLRRSGGKVQIWDCNDAPNQQWQFNQSGLLSAGGLCLDVHEPDRAKKGAKVQVWNCHYQPNQQWYFDTELKPEPGQRPPSQTRDPWNSPGNAWDNPQPERPRSDDPWQRGPWDNGERQKVRPTDGVYTPPPAVNPWDDDGLLYHRLISGGGLCLETHGRRNPPRLQICRPERPQQDWEYRQNNLISRSGECLATDRRGRLELQTCADLRSQEWFWRRGYLVGADGLCLHVPESELYRDGASALLTECRQAPHLLWRFE